MSGRPTCLTVGGSDGLGLSGIQADLRTFERLGCAGRSAITALTAQTADAFLRSEPAPLAQFDAELQAAFDDGAVSVVKTGMLVDAEHIALLAAHLSLHHRSKPLIVDPVLHSTSGAALVDEGGLSALREALLPLATLITPNLQEASALCAGLHQDADRMLDELCKRWPQAAILLKGGHAPDDEQILCDVLQLPDGRRVDLRHQRRWLSATRLRGTGCRLASAIAAHVACGQATEQAVRLAVDWLQAELSSPDY